MALEKKQPNLSYPPEVVLAELLYKKLGLEVTPEVMKSFVLDNWSLLSMLGHAIHMRGVHAKTTQNIRETPQVRRVCIGDQ